MKKLIPLLITFSCLSFLTSCNKENNQCLTLCALSDDTNLYVYHSNEFNKDGLPNLSYSLNNSDWKPITIYSEDDPHSSPFIKLKKDEKVYLKGNNPKGLSIAENKFIHISALDSNNNDIRFTSYGNIMSLIDDGRCKETRIPSDYCFSYLFGLTPYGSRSRIVRSPMLPATYLTKCCYDHMFFDDEDLLLAPKLNSFDIKEKCYAYMFAQCTSLKIAPQLCSNKTAPYCYDHMFYGNSSLEYIEIHINDWDRDGDFPCCFWVSFDGTYPMSSKGTFVCPHKLIKDINDPNNFSETRVPYHWTIKLI